MSVKKQRKDKQFLQVRIERSLVQAARAKAEKIGLTVSQVVRCQLAEFVSDPNGVLIFR